MPVSTLTSKGQVTIPKRLRQQLGLEAGDRLDFRLDDQGQLVARRADEPSYRRLIGMLGHHAKDRPVTVEEMRQAVHRRAAAKYGRR